MSKMRRLNRIKTALAFSVCLFAVWVMLGTNATLAWFSDTTETARNTFVIGEMDLDVSYRDPQTPGYAPLNEGTVLFGKDALYEPGYTEVIYLKIENKGNIDFDYKLSVNVKRDTESTNQAGRKFTLAPYLRFGVVFGDEEDEVKLVEREAAQKLATNKLSAYTLDTFSKADTVSVAANRVRYAAVVLTMPELVGNEANYRKGADVPEVEFGLTVLAQQAGAALT